MPRVNPRHLNPNEKMQYLDLLWTSIAGLENRQEIKNFFKDLLSECEAVMLARRILIAKLLLEGKTYIEIAEEIRTSVDTIAKVSQWLTSGFGGYEKAIKIFEQALARRKEVEDRKYAAPYSFAWLKNKYPLHFLLFNLMDMTSNKKEKGKGKGKGKRKKITAQSGDTKR